MKLRAFKKSALRDQDFWPYTLCVYTSDVGGKLLLWHLHSYKSSLNIYKLDKMERDDHKFYENMLAYSCLLALPN
jgi:hypothetical protein